MGTRRRNRRALAYMHAAKEVRDHLGNVVVERKVAEDARAKTVASIRANRRQRINDQSGVGA